MHMRLSLLPGVITAPAHSPSSNSISSPSRCCVSLMSLDVPSIGSGSTLTRLVRLAASSMAIQNPSPLKSYMTFTEPTGLFSGLLVVLNACTVSVPALSSLTFLGEWHSLAQWPGLPQLWHLPFFCRHLPSSDAEAAKASSVVESFFPPCPLVRRLFNLSASSQIWLTRASRSMVALPRMIWAADRR